MENKKPYVFNFPRQLAYGLGDFGYNFVWTLVSSFLLYFWTDSFGIAAATGGTILFVARFWDAIDDVILGRIMDRTKSKIGKYRFWVLVCIVPLAIMNVLCFTAMPIESYTGRVIYALATFFISIIFASMFYIGNGALPEALTTDNKARGMAATMRLAMAYICAILISKFTRPLVAALGGGDDTKGYMLTAIIYSALWIICAFVTFFNTKEVIRTPAKKIKFKESLHLLKGNRLVWALAFGFIGYALFNYGRGAVAVYYFQYYVGDASLYGTYALFHYGMSFVGAIAAPFFMNRAKSKGRVAFCGYLVGGIILCVQFFVNINVTGFAVFLVLQAVASFCFGLCATVLYGLTPEVVDYTQKIHGERAGGFLNAAIQFLFKVGMAIGSAAVGWILGGVGYVANQVQSPGVMTWINVLFTFIPGIFCFVAVIGMAFWNLSKSDHLQLLKELEDNKSFSVQA